MSYHSNLDADRTIRIDDAREMLKLAYGDLAKFDAATAPRAGWMGARKRLLDRIDELALYLEVAELPIYPVELV